jgi:hypothetical protein
VSDETSAIAPGVTPLLQKGPGSQSVGLLMDLEADRRAPILPDALKSNVVVLIRADVRAGHDAPGRAVRSLDGTSSH